MSNQVEEDAENHLRFVAGVLVEKAVDFVISAAGMTRDGALVTVAQSLALPAFRLALSDEFRATWQGSVVSDTDLQPMITTVVANAQQKMMSEVELRSRTVSMTP